MALMAIFILALLNLIYLLAKDKLNQMISTSGSASQLNTQIRKLTEYTFELWDLDLKEKLEKEGLLSAIETSLPLEDKVNKKAYNRIANSVPDELLSSVITTRSAFKAYCNLKEKYGNKTQKRQRMLEKDIAKMKLRAYDDKSVEEFIKSFTTAVARLQSAGGEVEASTFADMLADALSDDDDPYMETVKAAIRANCVEEAAVRHFQKECQRLYARGRSASDISQFARNRGVNQGNWRRPVNRGRWSKPGGPICFRCSEPGHVSSVCTKPLVDGSQSKPVLSTDNKDTTAYSCFSGPKLNVCVDSGTNAHHLPTKNVFSNIDHSRKGVVTLAGGQQSSVSGIGDAVIQNDSGTLLLDDARYTPEFINGLISVSRLADQGFSIIFDQQKATVTRQQFDVPTSNIEFIFPRVGDLYRTNVYKPDDLSFAAMTSIELHSAWGHPGQKATKELKKMYPSLNFESPNFCETCIMGKQRQLPYRSTNNHSYQPLELIHTDICESKCRGYNGTWYVVTFVDEYSKYAEVFPLKDKSAGSVLDVFKEFQARMERQMSTKIKKVRSDNGREYLGVFDAYLRDSGIQHQSTVPYRHQQNGTAERFNQTLLTKARCLMLEACLPERFWPLAVESACFLYNLSPHSSIEFEAPVKRLFPQTRTIIERGGQIHVFGSAAYKSIPAEKRNAAGASKLAPISEKLVFAGYDSLDNDTYLLLDPRTGVISRERNVVVAKGVFPFSKKKEGCQCSVLPPTQQDAPQADSIFNLSFVHSSGGEEDQGRADNEQPEEDSLPDAEPAPEPSAHEPIPTEKDCENSKSEEPSDSEVMTDDIAAEEEEPSAPQRTLRDRGNLHQPDRYGFKSSDTALAAAEEDVPKSFEEAINSPEAHYWKEACNDEMRSMLENQVYEEVPDSRDLKVVSTKWVFKKKKNAEGAVVRHKARLVAMGYVQRYNVDYWETYAPTVAATTLRTFLTVCQMKKMKVSQMDVTTAFLYGDIDGDIYLRPPAAYCAPGLVWKLNKSIYGLKQSSRCWSMKLNGILEKQGFFPTKSDRCLFVRRNDEGLAYVLVYVDDCLIAAQDEQELTTIKEELKKELNIKDLGALSTFIGVDFKETSTGALAASQSNYIDELSKRFNVVDAHTTNKLPVVDTLELDSEPVDESVPYRSIIGGLLYIASMTRPDISAAVSYLSRYLDRPSKKAWKLAKQVLNYLRHTKHRSLLLGQLDNSSIVTYADANFAPAGDRKSQSGAVFKLAGSTVGWLSKKQKTVSTSTTEAEYIALSLATNETLWLQHLLQEMGVEIILPTVIFEDNQPAIAIATNQRNPGLAKHLDVKLQAVSDYHQKGFIKVTPISSKDQLADGLTKVINNLDALDRLLGPNPESGGVLN